MSARNPGACAAPVALALLLVAAPAVADDVQPDGAFLEYLGGWEGTDEDWLMLRRGMSAYDGNDNERSDPVPDGNESQEHDDEN